MYALVLLLASVLFLGGFPVGTQEAGGDQGGEAYADWAGGQTGVILHADEIHPGRVKAGTFVAVIHGQGKRGKSQEISRGYIRAVDWQQGWLILATDQERQLKLVSLERIKTLVISGQRQHLDASNEAEPDSLMVKGKAPLRNASAVASFDKPGRIVLKLLGGTVAGIGTATAVLYIFWINADWCSEDWCSEDRYESRWGERLSSGLLLSFVPVGIATGVSAFDHHDRPIYPLAASLFGFGTGIALDIAAARGGSILGATLWLPVIAATVASEWSRDQPESRRYSIGLRPEPGGGLSAVAALRFQ